jgi:hypothetical protein
MKPVGDNQASASLLVVGHAVGLVFLCFAIHLTAAAIYQYFAVLLGDNWQQALAGFGHLILEADILLQTRWLWTLLAFGLVLSADWAFTVWLLRGQRRLLLRLWGHGLFGLMLLLTAMCVGLFRFWMWQLDQPMGSLG